MHKRVQDADGYRGTVRYEGPIHSKNQAQVYWGIEWDESSRGKHNGETDGHQYFKTVHPTNGSFVIPEKVTLGVGIIEALHARYMQNEADDVRVAGEVATSSGNSKNIQLVGVHKIQEKQDLSIIGAVSLEACKVSHLGGEGELCRDAPNIVELNLGYNLLASWSEIMKLSTELPKLEHVVLSGNVLAYDIDSTVSNVVFQTVQVLVLNQTRMKWKEILHVCQTHFPMLRELYVSSNEISDEMLLAEPPLSWPALEWIDISHNSIEKWSSLQHAFGSLPKLSQLVSNGNQLGSIVPSLQNQFQELSILSLSDNLISTWQSIDALNSFPKISSFRLTKNPLLAEMGPSESRSLIIARCKTLTQFNSSDIRPKERMEAEQMYLKRILHELACFPASERAKVLANHPRFDELSSTYRDIQGPNASSGSDSGPGALARSLARITFVCMSINATTMDPMEKKLPQNMKISQVKQLVQSKYGLTPTEHQLSFRLSKKAIPVPLDDDTVELSYYGVQDGGEILINDVW